MNEIKRIYLWRVQEAGKDALFSAAPNEFHVHSQMIGNLLQLSNFNKDLLAPFRFKSIQPFLRKNVWKALLAYPEVENEYAELFATDKARTLS
jgi:hypothetical protein